MWSPDDADVTVDIRKEQIETHSMQWRWMPPNLYFYVNFGTILHKDEDAPKTAPKVKIRPQLRDVEWEFFYNWMEARGFSGFEGDEEYTCNRDLKDYLDIKDDPEISEIKKEVMLDDIHKTAYKKDGSFKTYVPARKYLRKLFEKPMGDPVWENEARNLFMLGSRGFGKSYMVGVGIIAHTMLFDGMLRWDTELLKNPPEAEMVVGAALSDKSSDLISKAKRAIDHLPGEYGKYEDFRPAPFSKILKGSLQPNNGKNPWRHEYEKKVPGQGWKTFGTKTNMKHVIYSVENPEAAVGTRPLVMVIEEVGLLANVLDVHAGNETCLVDAETGLRFGSSIYLGTGGNMDKIRESEDIFRNPASYGFLEFDDEWEGRGKIGWFVPAQYAVNKFKDENGNTDYEAATRYLEDIRKEKRKGSSSSAIDKELMYRPMVPSEMFLTKRGNIFPIEELRKRLDEIKANSAYQTVGTPVNLFFDHNEKCGVNYKVVHDGNPLHDYPLKDSQSDREGCVVIYEFPYLIDGVCPPDMYIIGHDPYAKDDPEGESLGAVYVLKNAKYAQNGGHNEIVAEFVGRPYEGRHIINEIIEKLAMFYGGGPGMIYFENARGNVKEYFEKRKKLYLLAQQPRTILTKQPGYKKSSSITYGYPMDNKYVKIEAVRYARDWLVMERQEGGKTIRNLDKIWCKGLLEELIAFSMDEGNYDRAMAFFGCIVGLEETTNRYLEPEEDNGDVFDFVIHNPRVFKNQPVIIQENERSIQQLSETKDIL